jgi:ATP-dependent Clp protease ATP-binding subunit ClpA
MAEMVERRKYSVDEIDRMRRAVETLGGSVGAEERLRTYMLNRTTVEELESAARDKLDPVMQRQREIAREANQWADLRNPWPSL